jgi:hypothetical protein
LANEILKYSRAKAAVGSLVNAVAPSLYQRYEGWFGPLLPLPRQAPAGIDVRRFDFQAGINLDYIAPRREQGTHRPAGTQ